MTKFWRLRKTQKTKQQKVRLKTCHDCGLETIDAKSKGKFYVLAGLKTPSIPDKAPCLYCERNPKVDEEVFDFYSETWVLEQLADGSFSPTIEDPDKHKQVLLNVLSHCQKVYGSGKA